MLVQPGALPHTGGRERGTHDANAEKGIVHERRNRPTPSRDEAREGLQPGGAGRAAGAVAPGRVEVGARRVVARHGQPHRARRPVRRHARRARARGGGHRRRRDVRVVRPRRFRRIRGARGGRSCQRRGRDGCRCGGCSPGGSPPGGPAVGAPGRFANGARVGPAAGSRCGPGPGRVCGPGPGRTRPASLRRRARSAAAAGGPLRRTGPHIAAARG